MDFVMKKKILVYSNVYYCCYLYMYSSISSEYQVFCKTLNQRTDFKFFWDISKLPATSDRERVEKLIKYNILGTKYE